MTLSENEYAHETVPYITKLRKTPVVLLFFLQCSCVIQREPFHPGLNKEMLVKACPPPGQYASLKTAKRI